MVSLQSGSTEDMDVVTGGTSPMGQVSSSRPAGNHVLPTLVTGQGLRTAHSGNVSEREEVKKIHEENIKRMSEMSEKEILEEQAKLRASLGKCLLSFMFKMTHLFQVLSVLLYCIQDSCTF